THTPGMSALQLQRQLGIGRYETAWTMLQKLRRAMVRPDRELLHEKVEVDETYVGGPEPGLRGGRELGEKVLVVGAVEVRGKGSRSASAAGVHRWLPSKAFWGLARIRGGPPTTCCMAWSQPDKQNRTFRRASSKPRYP